MPHYSEPYVSIKHNLEIEDYHDFDIKVVMSYKCKFGRMFSKDIDAFIEWIDHLNKNLLSKDWTETEKHLTLVKELFISSKSTY